MGGVWNIFESMLGGYGGKGKGKGKRKNRLSTFDQKLRVWLGGIPEDLQCANPTDEGHKKLKEHLSQAGKCNFVSVTKGQGGAAFATEEEAQNAIATLNGSTFEGATIEVDVWTKKEKA